jgi:branched-subunit amino acid ABC-type transport system permease component
VKNINHGAVVLYATLIAFVIIMEIMVCWALRAPLPVAIAIAVATGLILAKRAAYHVWREAQLQP